MSSKSKRRTRKHGRVPPPPRRASARPRPVVAPRPRAAGGQPPRPPRIAAAPPRRIYGWALALAMLAGAALIGLSHISAHRHTAPAAPPSTTGLVGTSETAASLRGIPQHGFTLGSPMAPARLVEYADPQCPYCALYARDVLPTLIRDYVRPGKVQLEFRGLWFLGPDSGTALRTAVAAAAQNRFWNTIELIYRNQGPENAWVNDEVLRAIVTGAGADANKVFAARDGAAVASTVDGWARQAQADGVRGVPAFLIARRGASPRPVAVRALTVPEFRAALEEALRR